MQHLIPLTAAAAGAALNSPPLEREIRRMPDYDLLFDHLAGLPVVAIVTLPRAGSDFFQSLLDGHEEVVQVTGHFRLHEFWSHAICKSCLEDLIEEFVWDRRHISKFKSVYNPDERWDQLGEDRRESFRVDLNAFKRHLFECLKDRELTSRNFFLGVHLAYALAEGNPCVLKGRIVLCHVHEYYGLPDLARDFPDAEVIYCTRDPRNALVSAVEHLMADRDRRNLYFFRYWLKWIFTEADQVRGVAKNVRAMPLETLHLQSKSVLRQFCADFGLRNAGSLSFSTYHGKQWWGDARSRRFLKGFNPYVAAPHWRGRLNALDVFLIELLLQERMESYGNSVRRLNSFCVAMAPILFWIPMKYEIRIGWCDFRQSEGILRKLSSLLDSTVSYLRRVLLYHEYWLKRVRGTLYVAPSYGNNYRKRTGG